MDTIERLHLRTFTQPELQNVETESLLDLKNEMIKILTMVMDVVQIVLQIQRRQV